MKNAVQKIAAMIIIAIGVIFGVVLALVSVTIINNVDNLNGIFTYDKIGFTLLLVLAIIFVGLAAYLIISLFGGKANLKTMVLTSDNFSAVSTTNRVVRSIIKSCVNSLGGLKLTQTKITEDDKPGFKLGIFIKISDGSIQEKTQTLKFLLEDSFKSQLGFCFNSIIIKVVSLKNEFEPDLQRAKEHQKALQAEEDCKDSCKIAEPFPTEQAVLEKNLTPEELEQVQRQSEEDTQDDAISAEKDSEISEDTHLNQEQPAEKETLSEEIEQKPQTEEVVLEEVSEKDEQSV